MRKRINITARDIALGQREGASVGRNCPVARAAKRAFHTDKVWVSTHYLYAERVVGLMELPRSATRFMEDHSHGRPTAPFIFRVDVP